MLHKAFGIAALGLVLVGQAQACGDALVATQPKTGDQIVIGDYGCEFPETMVFRLPGAVADAAAANAPVSPQGAQPFDAVCSRLSQGGFSCGPNAPFGLANTQWVPQATTRWACKPQNYRPPKFVCSKGCDSQMRKLEFFVFAYECE